MSKIRKTKATTKYSEGEPVSEWKARISRMKKHRDKQTPKNWGRNKKLLFGASPNYYGGYSKSAFGMGTRQVARNGDLRPEPQDGRRAVQRQADGDGPPPN